MYSCTSEFHLDPVERIPTVRDTIYETIHDSINVTIATRDTIYEIIYDTIQITSYDTIQVTNYETIYETVYDTIYTPTRVALRFLYESDTYQTSGVDTLYLDGPEQVRWDQPEDPEACVNIITFELAPVE